MSLFISFNTASSDDVIFKSGACLSAGCSSKNSTFLKTTDERKYKTQQLNDINQEKENMQRKATSCFGLFCPPVFLMEEFFLKITDNHFMDVCYPSLPCLHPPPEIRGFNLKA